MNVPRRPILRWHGGKWRLAPWIISFFPKHRIYVEPYGGAASVLIRKERCYLEVYNDLDDEIVSLFQVLQSGRWEELLEALRNTPYARREFEASYEFTEDTFERSRRLIVRSFMGFGSDGHNAAIKTGFRDNANKSGTTPSHDWRGFPDNLPAIVDRFRGVVIESRPAMQVIEKHDGLETLHYLDPPYMPETRSDKSRRGKIRYHAYKHEMSYSDHEELLDFVQGLQGMVLISGYSSALYKEKLEGWKLETKETVSDGAHPRIECLWINAAAVKGMGDGPLFAEVT